VAQRESDSNLRNQKGFSLIELLIVVAIILIIAAIAVPNLLRSRMAANEASAVGSVRTINTSEVTYAATYANYGYTNMSSLGTGSATTPCPGTGAVATAACLVDQTIAGSGSNSSTHSGYQFEATRVAPAVAGQPSIAFQSGAWTGAANCNKTGMRSFFSDDSLVIRFDATGACPDPAGGSTAWSPLQ